MFSKLPFSKMFNSGNANGQQRQRNNSEAGTSSSSSSNNNNNKSSNSDYFGDNQNSESSMNVEPCNQVENSNAVIATKIARLYAEKLLSDITIIINGKEFPAHRLILCASSDVFQVMLMNPNWNESYESRIILKESDECAAHFEDFLRYLYTGRLKLELTNVLHILTLADKYNIIDLIVLSLNFMMHHVPSGASHNQLIHWYQYTNYSGHSQVANACKNFIKWNFEMIAKCEDFPHLDIDLLVNILQDDDIVVYDEFNLFKCLDCWIGFQRTKLAEIFECESIIEDHMIQIVKESMNYIRFPMMTPRNLAEIIPFPLTQKYKEYLVDKLAIGMSFHTESSDPLLNLIKTHPKKSKLFTPRLYVNENWSVCLSVDNFSSMNHYQSKTLVFSTPGSFIEGSSKEKNVEWVVDFFPKGVWFAKYYLIVWQGTVEVPEYVYQTVRLSLLCKSDDERDIKMQIGVLISGVQDQVDHVRGVYKKNYIFSDQQRINLDDLIPYGELIKCAKCSAKTNSESNPSSPLCCSAERKSCFLIGKNRDSLKIRISITPLSDFKF